MNAKDQKKALRLFQIVHDRTGEDSEREFLMQNPDMIDGWVRLARRVALLGDQPDMFDPDTAVAVERGWHLDAKRVLAFLNNRCNRKFRETDANMAFISARLSEKGITAEDCFDMIDRQAALWEGTHMEQYLRPETLFNATKFDAYYASRLVPVIKQEPTVHPMTQLSAVRESILDHPANSNSVSFKPNHTKADKEDLRRLREREKELLRAVAQCKTRAQPIAIRGSTNGNQSPTVNPNAAGGRLEQSAAAGQQSGPSARISSLIENTTKAVASKSGSGQTSTE